MLYCMVLIYCYIAYINESDRIVMQTPYILIYILDSQPRNIKMTFKGHLRLSTIMSFKSVDNLFLLAISSILHRLRDITNIVWL